MSHNPLVLVSSYPCLFYQFDLCLWMFLLLGPMTVFSCLFLLLNFCLRNMMLVSMSFWKWLLQWIHSISNRVGLAFTRMSLGFLRLRRAFACILDLGSSSFCFARLLLGLMLCEALLKNSFFCCLCCFLTNLLLCRILQEVTSCLVWWNRRLDDLFFCLFFARSFRRRFFYNCFCSKVRKAYCQ